MTFLEGYFNPGGESGLNLDKLLVRENAEAKSVCPAFYICTSLWLTTWREKIGRCSSSRSARQKSLLPVRLKENYRPLHDWQFTDVEHLVLNEAADAPSNAGYDWGLLAYWSGLTNIVRLIMLAKGIHFLSIVWIYQENGVRFASENHYGWQVAVCRQSWGYKFAWWLLKKSSRIRLLTMVWKRPGVPHIFRPGQQCRMERLGTVCCTPRLNREPSNWIVIDAHR